MTSEEFAEHTPTISRTQAERLLREHSLKPSDYYKEHPATGDHVDTQSVLDWVGY